MSSRTVQGLSSSFVVAAAAAAAADAADAATSDARFSSFILTYALAVRYKLASSQGDADAQCILALMQAPHPSRYLIKLICFITLHQVCQRTWRGTKVCPLLPSQPLPLSHVADLCPIILPFSRAVAATPLQLSTLRWLLPAATPLRRFVQIPSRPLSRFARSTFGARLVLLITSCIAGQLGKYVRNG